MQVAAYDKTQGKMAFFDPSRPQDFLFISGTKVLPHTNLRKSRESMSFHSFSNRKLLPFVSKTKKQKRGGEILHWLERRTKRSL